MEKVLDSKEYAVSSIRSIGDLIVCYMEWEIKPISFVSNMDFLLTPQSILYSSL